MVDPIAELNNPSTSATRLFELAQSHPEFGPQIAAHPNTYPELQAWIAQYASGVAANQTGPQQTTPLTPLGPQVYDPMQAATPFAATPPVATPEPQAHGIMNDPPPGTPVKKNVKPH